MSEWQPLLRSLDIPLDRAAALAALARKNGTDFQTELLISGEIGEEDFYRALAVELGLGYAASLEPERLIVTDAIAVAFLRRRTWHIPVKIAEKDGATCYLIAPERIGLGRSAPDGRKPPGHRMPFEGHQRPKIRARAVCARAADPGQGRGLRPVRPFSRLLRPHRRQCLAGLGPGRGARRFSGGALGSAGRDLGGAAFLLLVLLPRLRRAEVRRAPVRAAAVFGSGGAGPGRRSAGLFGARRPLQGGRHRTVTRRGSRQDRVAEEQARDKAGLRGGRSCHAGGAPRPGAAAQHGGGRSAGVRAAHQAQGAGLCLPAGQRRVRRALRCRGPSASQCSWFSLAEIRGVARPTLPASRRRSKSRIAAAARFR